MKVIAVIGGNSASRKYYDLAFRAGAEIARQNCMLVCGGLSGVMEAAAKGARANKGTTIGILPGKNRQDANEYIDIAVPTGIGEARNVVIVNMADGVVAIDGKEGTLSEIAFTLKNKKPICGIGTYDIPGIIKEEEPEKAVEKICKLIEAGK
jgi:uncharacterized protein (TIGR00725 family)